MTDFKADTDWRENKLPPSLAESSPRLPFVAMNE